MLPKHDSIVQSALGLRVPNVLQSSLSVGMYVDSYASRFPQFVPYELLKLDSDWRTNGVAHYTLYTNTHLLRGFSVDFLLFFLDATSHLSKRVCPSVRRSIRPSVHYAFLASGLQAVASNSGYPVLFLFFWFFFLHRIFRCGFVLVCLFVLSFL